MNNFDAILIGISCIIIVIFVITKLTKMHDDAINIKVRNLLKEDFIVADAQDLQNYDKLKAETEQLPDNFNKDTLTNPDKSKIVNPESEPVHNSIISVPNVPIVNTEKDKQSFITASDFGWEKPWPIVACANSSINNRYKTGPKHLLPYQIACGYANKITAENYYKTHFQAKVASMNDMMVKGANYDEYSSFTHPSLITQNARILSQNTKGLYEPNAKYKNIPTGSNYAFNNIPAFSVTSPAMGGPVVSMP